MGLAGAPWAHACLALWGAELHPDWGAGGGKPWPCTPRPSSFAPMGAPWGWGCPSPAFAWEQRKKETWWGGTEKATPGHRVRGGCRTPLTMEDGEWLGLSIPAGVGSHPAAPDCHLAMVSGWPSQPIHQQPPAPWQRLLPGSGCPQGSRCSWQGHEDPALGAAPSRAIYSHDLSWSRGRTRPRIIPSWQGHRLSPLPAQNCRQAEAFIPYVR